MLRDRQRVGGDIRRVLCVLLFFATPCTAQGPHYLVVSTVGDQLTLVRHGAGVATNISNSSKQVIALPTADMDKAALGAIDEALHAIDATASTTLVLPHDPSVLAAQDKALDENDLSVLARALAPYATNSGATRMLLVSRYRHKSEFDVGQRRAGGEVVDGLGYYIDDTLRVPRDISERDYYRGALFPFVYIRLAEIEVPGMRVIRVQEILAFSVTVNDSARASAACGEGPTAIFSAKPLSKLSLSP